MKIEHIGFAPKPLMPVATSTAADSQTEPADISAPKSDKVPGVVRLINEGHFKPTADVRLRLNFAEFLDTSETLTPAENVPGKAYGKFLSLYQELYGQAETTEPDPDVVPLPDATNSVDITV